MRFISLVSVCTALMAGGCAAPQPVPFNLIGATSKIQHGALFPNSRRIEATIEGQAFTGFYIVETGTAVSESLGPWRFHPHDTLTTFSTNSARAQLRSENNQHLNCEFLFEGRRAIGKCQTPSGETYQLVADEGR